MTWTTEAALERALGILKERYPSQKIEIIALFDIAHVRWECDSQGALIRRDSVPEFCISRRPGTHA